ncbi:hypothetical protein HMPREF9018_1974 [Prevotella amnii CRIS 21A-A]|uniref:Uncharacterized protein n=1 Tax=Prevotella amnii CRIS 21A-A TaxID=679191 RepID=E1GX60_9BACT|nr:hypothetical protein HMPREF9018_1974 [Prevotella amnii CRIS 21A-A]
MFCCNVFFCEKNIDMKRLIHIFLYLCTLVWGNYAFILINLKNIYRG